MVFIFGGFMNKYEDFFDEICKLTQSHELKWKQINKKEHSDVIFNPNLVFRQFSAEYTKNDILYIILFIEKKYSNAEYDYELEKYDPEILVLDEDMELKLTLTDSVIDRYSMQILSDLISEEDDKVKNLLD